MLAFLAFYILFCPTAYILLIILFVEYEIPENYLIEHIPILLRT